MSVSFEDHRYIAPEIQTVSAESADAIIIDFPISAGTATDEELPLKLTEEQQHFVLQNEALAVDIAKHFHPRNFDRDDLYQYAREGLIQATLRFEPERGLQFSTYATPFIDGFIKRAIRDDRLIRRPRRVAEALPIYEDAIDTLQNQQKPLDPASISSKSGLSQETVEKVQKAKSDLSLMSIDQTDECAVGNIDPAYENVENSLVLFGVLRTLTERELGVTVLYHGLIDRGPSTQAEIALLYGYSQVHVSRILKLALTKLRVGIGSVVEKL